MIGFFIKVLWVLQILGITHYSYGQLIVVTILYLILHLLADYFMENYFPWDKFDGYDEENNDDEDNKNGGMNQ